MPLMHVRDLEMYYELEGTGTPMVLIGGLSNDHAVWPMQVPAFTGAGYQALVFDSRDTGQTSASSVPYSIRDLADDAARLMAELGLPPAHVVGLSMGGMVAQELALNHADRLASITLVGSVAAVDGNLAGLIATWKNIRPQCAPDEFFREISPWLLTYRFYARADELEAFMQIVRENPYPQDAARFRRQCDAVLTHDTRSRLSAIAVPTHVIVGKEDVLTPPRYSRALADAIPGARLTEIDACGHGLFWERPDEFNRAVLEFLDRLPKHAAAAV